MCLNGNHCVPRSSVAICGGKVRSALPLGSTCCMTWRFGSNNLHTMQACGHLTTFKVF